MTQTESKPISMGKTSVSGARTKSAIGAIMPDSESEIISCCDKRFEDLTLADDFMFKVVFSNPKICKQLIEIILKKKIVRLGFCPCFFLGFALFLPPVNYIAFLSLF